MGRHRALATALLIALYLTSALAARHAAAAPQGAVADPESLAEFETVCLNLRDGTHAYFGHALVGELLRRTNYQLEPMRASLLRYRLGHELIRIGRHEEAIQYLQESVDLASQHADPAQKPGILAEIFYKKAMAHLQLAEDQNCLQNHAATSCILPIRRDAVHPLPQHANEAADLFIRILEIAPDDAQARWLLNLTRMLTGNYPAGVPERYRLPDPQVFSDPDEPRWEEVGWKLGLSHRDLGGGAIMDDFDGDGLLDIVSSSWDPCEPMKALRNDGQGGFENVSEAWGLTSQLGGININQADYDGDGALDILVLRGAWLGEDGRIRNSLLRNDLKGPSGRFVDVTAEAGLAYPAYPTQNAAWADFDLDGDLDVFIGNESTATSTNQLSLIDQEGTPYPSQLLRNNGNGTFTDVAKQAGVENFRFSKGSSWGDFDRDGDPDLYVSNFGPNRLYRNNGDGTFIDVASATKVAEPAKSSFPTWFFDFDNDGDLDLFVARYKTPAEHVAAGYFGASVAHGNPVLHLNEGGTFRDISAAAGLTDPLLVMGANFGDLDNDGFPDVYLGTGLPDFDSLMPNIMYRNEAGRRFQDVTFDDGFGQLQKGHGVAFGDIDNDGEQELFQQLGGAYPFDTYGNALYENPGSGHHWITLRLHSQTKNTRGVGARIEVQVLDGGERRSVFKWVGSGGSFGASSLQQEIGLGAADAIERIVVDWPGGDPQTFDQVPIDRIYDLHQGATELIEVHLPKIELGATGPAAHDHPN